MAETSSTHIAQTRPIRNYILLWSLLILIQFRHTHTHIYI